MPSFSTTFHARMQLDGESLADYSRVLMRLHSRMGKAAVTRPEEGALVLLRDIALKEELQNRNGLCQPIISRDEGRGALVVGRPRRSTQDGESAWGRGRTVPVDQIILQVLHSQLQSHVMHLASQ